MNPLGQFKPDPPPVNFNDKAYQQLAAAEALRVAEITAALTLIARYAPGPVAKVAGLAAVAFLGNPGENKKGNIGGAKTNPLPAPVGFADPKVFGLQPNYYLPNGVTQFVPQPVDLLGLGFNEQRFQDQSREAFEFRNRQRIFASNMLAKSDDQLAKLLKVTPEFGTIFKDSSFGGNDVKLAQIKVAAQNEQLFRQRPDLRAAVNFLNFIPTDVLSGPNGLSDDAIKQIIAAGSLQPELIEPVNAKAIANKEAAEGIRRNLVTEWADP